jgi:glyoxylase-like metal-dependent hydrolase (beta-lactamase superfamily II)
MNPMILQQIRTGGDRNFGYWILDESTKKAAVVDPSGKPDIFLELAKQVGAEIQWVIATHDHGDHTDGICQLDNSTGAKVVFHKNAMTPADHKVHHGDKLPLGKLELEILHTPGHTTDSISVLVEDALITGDTLFVGKVGGTGFGQDARDEYNSLHQILMKLPDHIRVFPGHDYGVAPESTIGHERNTNPFLLRPDFESFLELKKTWLEYKRIHGIA